MKNLEGQKAPAFSLEGNDGKKHSLEDYRGKTVVLYFYPKDDTPGCTKEACGFRDLGSSLKKSGAVVLGAVLNRIPRKAMEYPAYDSYYVSKPDAVFAAD